MASTIGMRDRAVQPDETVLNGLKRPRFSLHFNTRRVRYWILVQLVRVPVQTRNELEIAYARPVEFRGLQTSIKRLVDDYMVAQFAHRWV
jgi:hypothetical protein